MVDALSIKKIFRKLQNELKIIDRSREKILRESRAVTRTSKQAIFQIHRGNIEDAKKMLDKARKKLAEITTLASSINALASSGALNAAFEEYIEARALFRFVEHQEFLDPKIEKVPIAPYLLGLGDFIGELRRQALDSIRLGKLEKAEECLLMMEEVYITLVSLENVHGVVSNLRRKTDIARKLIELTRGDVTTETRRSKLESSLNEVNKRLNKEKKR